MVQIEYIDYGIGFTRSDGVIELNKNLKKYPDLHKAVLKHELGHLKKGSRKVDFLHDFLEIFNVKKQVRLLNFCIKHPRAFMSELPIFITKEGVFINWYMVIFWIGSLGISLTVLTWVFK